MATKMKMNETKWNQVAWLALGLACFPLAFAVRNTFLSDFPAALEHLIFALIFTLFALWAFPTVPE